MRVGSARGSRRGLLGPVRAAAAAPAPTAASSAAAAPAAPGGSAGGARFRRLRNVHLASSALRGCCVPSWHSRLPATATASTPSASAPSSAFATAWWDLTKMEVGSRRHSRGSKRTKAKLAIRARAMIALRAALDCGGDSGRGSRISHLASAPVRGPFAPSSTPAPSTRCRYAAIGIQGGCRDEGGHIGR